MDHWRNYFQTANGDIFEVIRRAIEVAAADHPNEFRIHRDGIAERLFTCHFQRRPNAAGNDNVVEVLVEEREGVVKDNSDGSGVSDDTVGKESKGGSSSTNVHVGVNETKASGISYNEVEALTDMIDQEHKTIEEVLRIKAILENSIDQSSSALLESLRRLELMDVGMQTLLATSIGTAVSALRKHPIKEISKLARNLVRSWKTLTIEWVASTEAAKTQGSNESPDSVNPSVNAEEECGLPSPPLDEGAFFAAEPTSMELSKFFDGMDDLGNPICEQPNDENGRINNSRKENSINQKRGSQFPREQNVLPKDNKNHLMVKQGTLAKQNHPSHADSIFAKSSKLGLEPKANHELKLQQNVDLTRTQRKPGFAQPDAKPKPSGQLLDQKLEIAKRKLQEGYQQAENAKKQRTIQVMDFQDLPKQGFSSNSKNSHVRPGSHNNRGWSNGRR